MAQAKAVAATVLDVPEAEIDFTDGLFVAPNSNRRLTIYRRGAGASTTIPRCPPPAQTLHAKATFTGRIPAYPTGCAICEVEIDPDTGAIEHPPLRLDRRRRPGDQSADPARPGARRHRAGRRPGADGGRRSTTGIGQVLTGSFMDYGMPRAASCSRRSRSR